MAMHLLLSPGDLLGLFTAALLAGLHGTRVSCLTVIALPVFWFAAGMVGLSLPVTICGTCKLPNSSPGDG